MYYYSREKMQNKYPIVNDATSVNNMLQATLYAQNNAFLASTCFTPRLQQRLPSYNPSLQNDQNTEKIRQHIIQQIRAPPPHIKPQSQLIPSSKLVQCAIPQPYSSMTSQKTEKRSRFLNVDDERVSPTKRKKATVATAIMQSSCSSQTDSSSHSTSSTAHLKDVNGNQMITRPILEYFDRHKQSETVYEEKLLFRENIYKLLLNIFPYCGLYIVGSSITGFSMDNSDMDLCLMLTFDKVDQRKEALSILFLIQKTLRRSSFISCANVIRARVPILKIKSKSGIESDLNINNSVGIRNTHLLKHYAMMDDRVRPLVLYVKKWAKFHDINDASKMTISSYSLTLMVLHYLQSGCAPHVLPCLQKDFPAIFVGSTDVRDLRPNENLEKFESRNTESVGDLFLGFLKYYTLQYNYQEDVISVRTGSVLSLYMVRNHSASVDSRDWKYLNIEEPFDRTNTARSVYDGFTFDRIRRVFRLSYQTLLRRRDPSDLFQYPF